MAFFDRLSLRVKMLLVCWTFLVPIGFLLYVTVAAYDKDIDFGAMERDGVRYLRPALALLAAVTDHQQATQQGQAAEESAARVDAAFADLEKVQAEVGVELQFTKEGLAQRKRDSAAPESVKKEWDAVKTAPTADGYKALIGNVRTIIAHAGDTSNLMLDPDLDSYYVMDTVVVSIPQNIDRANNVESSLFNVKKGATKLNNSEFAVFESMLREADVERTGADVQTALAEDGNFYGRNELLQGALAKDMDAYKAAAAPVYAGLLALKDRDGAGALVGPVRELRHTAFKTWESAANAMDSLLEARIKNYSGKKQTALWSSVAMVLAMSLASFFVIGRISRKIEGFVDGVKRESDELAVVSDKMDYSVQEASMATTEQSAAIEETVSSMEEMSSMLALTTQNATQAADETTRNLSDAERGRGVVNGMVSAMSQISESNEQLQSIVRVIDEIKTKTKVINDIAFETRLLAFNASIEAARAGAHGRGFAVVAEEVGKLADVSSKAADEVTSLLEGSVQQVNRVLSQTRQRVEEGQRNSMACSDAFSGMEESVKRIADGIGRIANAAREQDIGVKQTNEAMQEMEKVAQTNARSSERIATQSAQLRTFADNLRKNVTGMQRLVMGVGKSAHATAASTGNGPHGGDKPQAPIERTLPPPPKMANKKPLRAVKSEEIDPQKVGRNDSRWSAAS